MDLSKLNVTAASDKARRMVIIDPFLLKPVVDENGDELAIHFYGKHSTIARNKRAELEKELPKSPIFNGDPQVFQEKYEAHQAKVKEVQEAQEPELLAALVAKLDGSWEYQGKEIKPGSKELADLFRTEDVWLTQPARLFISNMSNYRPQT